MAERYGGKYSPEEDRPRPNQPPVSRWQGKRRTRAGGRANMLFLAPLPLAIRAFTQDPAGLALNLAGFAILMLAASTMTPSTLIAPRPSASAAS